jgi:hypothetical protein
MLSNGKLWPLLELARFQEGQTGVGKGFEAGVDFDREAGVFFWFVGKKIDRRDAGIQSGQDVEARVPDDAAIVGIKAQPLKDLEKGSP